MSLWTEHRARWSSCQLCDLCKTRKNVVLARGTIPCSVLFVGEAPGPSEDRLAKPFVGPAGHLLDSIISTALEGYGVSWAMTNLVSCIPQNVETAKKFEEPPEYSIKACRARLTEFVGICQPKLLVAVGSLAGKWLLNQKGLPIVSIVHPAAILRADISQKELQVRRAVVVLSDAVAMMKARAVEHAAD